MMKDSTTPTAPPGLFTQRIDKPLVFQSGGVAAAVGMTLLVILVFVFFISAFSLPVWAAVVVGIIFALMAFVGVWKGRRKRLAKIQQIVAECSDGDLCEIVKVIVQLGNLDAECPPMGKLPSTLVSAGRLDQTVQVGWDVGMEPIEPLTVAFEPRLLNETDEAFDELAQAATSQGATLDRSVADSPTHYGDRMALRWFLRNIKLSRGWLPIVILTWPLIGTGLESWERGSVTWQFLAFLSGFLISLFGGARMGAFSKAHWLIVPGGMLLRKAANRGRGVSLHLFDRRRSVLGIQQQRSGRWHVAVADSEASETTIVTDRERQLLLRAWLSPLTPPPLERLVDLS